MLPNPALKETYDKIVWVYVYRDFSKSKEDRAAERISMRFGVSSWPQIFLVDPRDDEGRAPNRAQGRDVPRGCQGDYRRSAAHTRRVGAFA